MQRDLGIYGGLLVVGLGLAYWASQPAPESKEDRVQVYSLDPKAITEVTFTSKDPKSQVEIIATASKRPDDERFWVAYTKTEPVEASKPADDKTAQKPPVPAQAETAAKSPADAKSAASGDLASGPEANKTPSEAPVTSPASKISKERFLAGERFDDVVKGFNPLMASRVFNSVSDEQLGEFGLKEATQVFTVKARDGQTFTLKLGRKSYGSSSRFAAEQLADGKVGRIFLIEDQNFENMERAPVRLYDRRLVAVELSDVQKATILAEGRAPKKLAHTQRDKNGELIWTDDEEGASAKPSHDSWMERLAKLRLLSYGEPQDESRLAQVKPTFEVTLEKDGKVIDTLRFKKEMQDGKAVYWVTSDFLRSHAKVPPARLEPIEKDLGAVMTSPKS